MLRPFYQSPLAVLQIMMQQTINLVTMVENADCVYRWIHRDRFIAHFTHLTVDSESTAENPSAYIGASSWRSDKIGRLFAHPYLQYNMIETLGQAEYFIHS